MSVPALMGTLMCIGLTTANSILVVTFANQRMSLGDSARAAAASAGFTRIRPVLMTAGAMILGMISDGIGCRRRRRTKRAACPRCHRRTAFCHLCNAAVRADRLSAAAPAAYRPAPTKRRPQESRLQPEDTGRRIRRAAIAVAVALAMGFLIVHLIKYIGRTCSRAIRAPAGASLPIVDVVAVHGGSAAGSLTLPGETAAWYESTIYARVSGYVGKWYVDIGDHVQAGQLLASIDTPEMDAELAAAKAKLNVAQSQVKVREADAAFATSTYARWRDSPKGVVSEQEREDKKAGDASARRSCRRRARRWLSTRRTLIA